MTGRPGEPPGARARPLLEAWLAAGGDPGREASRALAAVGVEELEPALEALAGQHGERAVALLGALAEGQERHLRRAARRVLYRLVQRGVAPPPAPAAPPPVLGRRHERPVRAWLSGIDGTGSRAVWILFEDGWGGRRLCSLIVNDTAGVLEAAGGPISRRRLEQELAGLRAAQKLPWVETDPERTAGLVAEALEHHRRRGDRPPAAFEPWRAAFDPVIPPPPPRPPADIEEALVEGSAALLDLPELAGWFPDPEAVQAEALELLQGRESRLVVSEQIKAEREEAVVRRVVERELGPAARARWARRLLEMALLFDALDRAGHAAQARAAAAALADEGRDVGRHPLARALARRALDVAAEVALGRLSATEASRRPAAGPPPPAR